MIYHYIQGKENSIKSRDNEDALKVIRQDISKSLNTKNVSFLLGAGCSSQKINDNEMGIPTMSTLAKEFKERTLSGDYSFPTSDDLNTFKLNLGIDILDKRYTTNLESLLELLYALKFSLHQSEIKNVMSYQMCVKSTIDKIKVFLTNKCTKDELLLNRNPVLKTYQAFYRRLIFRNESLPSPWIFTTNYDLYNEVAMDRIGVSYFNGFSGVVERIFNPSTYRYALAQQIDTSSSKWSTVRGFVYFCKLHGSVNWVERNRGLFQIREANQRDIEENVMIYPTPLKHSATIASPYADMFREFHSRIVREQSVLFIMGYSFSDTHINNIIYQALTIPTFRLIVFSDIQHEHELNKLIALNDPRIWIIGGESDDDNVPLHYFDRIVNDIMPMQSSEKIDDALEKIREQFSTTRNEIEQ